MTSFGRPERCPACGASALEPVFDGDQVNFFCRGCRRCWHQDLGVLHRVPAPTCPGCPHRDVCLELWAAEREAASG